MIIIIWSWESYGQIVYVFSSTERIYMMVTDGSEHIIAPTPTTLSFHHTPKSHPLPIFVIPSLSTDRFVHYDTITSVAPFEGHTNSPPVTIITSETVSTVSQKSDVMSDKMGSTELKTETTPTTTRCHVRSVYTY